MNKIKNIFKKYLNQRVRNIISIFVIIFGLIYIIDYSFYKPTYINKYIAMNIYKTPANNAFTDQNFYNCVIDAYNKENHSSLGYTANLSDEQLKNINYLNCVGYGKQNDEKIKNTTGLEKLVSLIEIDLSHNQLTNIDVSRNTELVQLNIYYNQLTSIDVSNNSKLEQLYIYNNQLTSLDVSSNTMLKQLYAKDNNLIDLDIDRNINLEVLWAENNQLFSIDVKNNYKLKVLAINSNRIDYIDLSENKLLENLWLDNNPLIDIDLSQNVALKYLRLFSTQLTSLDVSKNTQLEKIIVRNAELSFLDVSNNILLDELDVSNNQLMTLNVSENVILNELYINNNQLTSLDVSKNSKLKKLEIYNNQLTNIDVSRNTELEQLYIYKNQLTSLDVSNNIALKTLEVEKNQLIELNVVGAVLLGYLSAFSNQLTSLDVSSNTALKYLDISGNKLISLNLSPNVELKELNASGNRLTSIDLSSNNKLGVNVGNSVVFLQLQNNNFNNVLTRYVGDSGNANSAVKLPSHLEQDITWKSSDENIAVSDNDGNITTKKTGTVNIVGNNKYYTTKTVVNVFEMTSDIYEIDNNKLYIYVGNEKNADTIKNNIVVPDYVVKEVDLNNNVLKLKKNGYLLKEFKIVRINSNNYEISNDYIYTRHYKDISDLSCYNCNASIENNNVIIKYNDVEIDRYKLIRFSNKYTLYCIDCPSGAGIYTRMDNDEEIITNLAVVNGNAIINNNILKIMYNDILLDEFDIRGFSTNYKLLEDNSLYTGFNKFNIDNVSFRGNKVSGIYSNDLFKVIYDNIIIETLDVISLSKNNIVIHGNNIITEKIDYNTFISSLSNIDYISYKVFNNKNEVTSGDIEPGSILNVYYNNKLIDKYYINKDYDFTIDDSVNVLEDELIIYDLESGSKVEDLLGKINTNGNISILDKDGSSISNDSKIKTGYILRVIFDNDIDTTTEYILSVKGDVLGTGELSRNNAKEIGKNIINKNEFSKKEYFFAADYNNNGIIEMNDAIKMLREIKESSH